MESTVENITEMESEPHTNKEVENGEQSQDNGKEIENKNVGEEAPVGEHIDSACPMVIEEDTSLASSPLTPTLEKGVKDDDEKDSQLETNLHVSSSPTMTSDPEVLITPTVEETVEQKIGPGDVSSDGDSVMVDKDTAVVHDEVIEIHNTKLSEKKESPHTVMEQEKSAEQDDVISLRDQNEFPANLDTEESPHHHVKEQEKAEAEDDLIFSGDHNELPVNLDTEELPHHVMEQEKAAEEDDLISSGDHNEFPVNLDTEESPHHHVMEQEKAAEEADEIISSGDRNEFPANPDSEFDEKDKGGNMNLSDEGTGPVNHDQVTTEELDNVPDVPGSETVSKLDEKPSEPLIETSINVEKEPEIDKNSDILAGGVSGDNDKAMTTLEDEPTEDMKLDVSDSILVADAIVADSRNQDNSIVPERNEADIDESASVRYEPAAPPYVAPSNIKSEVGVSGDLNNGVHKQALAPLAFDRTRPTPNRSFLLDDTSEGYESGTEEDQSGFMKELGRFFRERNMEFKPPKFYGEGLNCLKLWRAVTRLGGYDKVTGCKLWRQVGESFRPPKTCTTVSWTFRIFYEKALLEYERYKVSEGELHIPLASGQEPMSIEASGSGRARRDAASRAMKGSYSQRLNGNSEVNDPANKDKNLAVQQKHEKQIETIPGLLKRKRQASAEHSARNVIVCNPMLDVTVVDVGPPADWVKINVQKTQDCFEVYALIPGLVREEVRVQSDPAGRLVISGEPENPMNPWGATPFKKVVNLPTRIDPHHTSAVVTLNGQLFVRVPLEQPE